MKENINESDKGNNEITEEHIENPNMEDKYKLNGKKKTDREDKEKSNLKVKKIKKEYKIF